MRYRKVNYKYQLVEPLYLQSSIRPADPINIRWVELNTCGRLRLATWYAWDGPSGPAIDTDNFMAPSAGHDALYQLIKRGALPPECFEAANEDMRRWCRERGMWEWRVWWCFKAVQWFGDRRLTSHRKVYQAP